MITAKYDNFIYKTLDKAIYESINNGQSPYILNKTIFCFWTGTNPMTANRVKNLDSLKQLTECNVELVTPYNLHKYILPDQPLHEAYQYLSETHKADYLRTYFMHFHGGGYTDIKNTNGSWLGAFDDMLANSHIYINSYKEFDAGCIAYPPAKSVWDRVAGNCAYICRPRTPFTEQWYMAMIKLLDEKLPTLKLHPAISPQDCAPSKSGYPIEWNEMLGRIFHKVCSMYLDHIMHSVPRVNLDDYR
jgi:hypothetical protein